MNDVQDSSGSRLSRECIREAHRWNAVMVLRVKGTMGLLQTIADKGERTPWGLDGGERKMKSSPNPNSGTM